MLLFISLLSPEPPPFNTISIHLMLLFIITWPLIQINQSISIHLMLLFIDNGVLEKLKVIIFQYISCYCLSEKTRWGIFRLSDFNTSHVTVYLLFRVSVQIIQWISIHLMLLFIKDHPFMQASLDGFQYISCYCLSGRDRGYRCSYVTFQYISCYCLSAFSCATSAQYVISIHLMLLFIDDLPFT